MIKQIECRPSIGQGAAATGRWIVVVNDFATLSETVRVPALSGNREATIGGTMGATMEQASDGRSLHKRALIRWAASYSPEG